MKKTSLAAALSLALPGLLTVEALWAVRQFQKSADMPDAERLYLESRFTSGAEELPSRPASMPAVRFVQVTDSHHSREDEDMSSLDTKERRLRDLVRFCNETLQPNFVVHTGDFVYPGKGLQLRRCRAILDHLDCPWIPVCGNHDGPDFTDYFGRLNWSFDVSGCHFSVFPVMDTYALSDTSLRDITAWFEQDLEASRDRPCFVFTHDPIFVWSDLARVHCIVERAGNVISVVSGHLHTDMKITKQGVAHVTTWMFARTPHRIKLFDIYPEGVWVTSYEYVGGDEIFVEQGPKYFLTVPERLSAKIERQ